MFITQQNVSFFHCFPYYEEGRGIFFWKNELSYGPPFFKIHFSKIVSRICTPILSSIGPAGFEKNDFFVKNWPFLTK